VILKGKEILIKKLCGPNEPCFEPDKHSGHLESIICANQAEIEDGVFCINDGEYCDVYTNEIEYDEILRKNKIITPEELFETMFHYCIPKMYINNFKSNPFKIEGFKLLEREREEYREKIQALDEYKKNPTEENKIAVIMEIADVINFNLFQAGKLLGFEDLER